MEKYSPVLSAAAIFFPLVFFHTDPALMIGFSGLCSSLSLLLLLSKGKTGINIGIVSLFILAFILSSLSSLISQNPYKSLLYSWPLVIYAIVFILGKNQRLTENKIFLYFLTLISSFQSVVALTEYANRFRYSSTGFSIAYPFYSPDFSAFFFLISSLISVWLFLDEDRKPLRIFLFTATVLTCLTLVISGKFLWLFTLSSAMLLKSDGIRKKIMGMIYPLSLAVLCIIFLSVYLKSSFGSNPIPFQFTQELEKSVFSSPSVFYDYLSRITTKEVLVGIGPENILAYSKSIMTMPYTWSGYFRNSILQKFAETGIQGAVVFSILISVLFYSSLKNMLTANDKDSGSMLLIRVISLIFLAGHFLIPLSASIPLNILLFSILGRSYKNLGTEIQKKLAYAALFPVIMIFFSYFTGSVILGRAKNSMVSGQGEVAEKMISLNIRRPSVFVDPKNQIWLAALELDRGNRQRALIQLKKAEGKDRLNDEIPYQISRLEFLSGNKDKAARSLEEYLNNNSYAPPQYYDTLVKYYTEEKNIALAAFWAKRAILYYPITKDFRSIDYAILKNISYIQPLKDIYKFLYLKKMLPDNIPLSVVSD